MNPIHIVTNKENIKENVLLPGDPLRAKYIAEKYLDNAREINNIRNMLGFTGSYKGKEITVIGSGMGIPSASLFKNFATVNIPKASISLANKLMFLGTLFNKCSILSYTSNISDV